MKKTKALSAIIATGLGLALATSVAAQANGNPQRSADFPPGLQKVMEKAVPGISKAILANEGSNSRLQDAPTSP